MDSPRASSPTKCGRPPNSAYIKLMKQGEDWRNVADAAERRKLQNRLAQRAYRRSLRDKSKEVEALRRQLSKLQDNGGRQTAGVCKRSSSSSGKLKAQSRSPELSASSPNNCSSSISSVSPRPLSPGKIGQYPQHGSSSESPDLDDMNMVDDVNFLWFDTTGTSSGSESCSATHLSSVNSEPSDVSEDESSLMSGYDVLGISSDATLLEQQNSGSIPPMFPMEFNFEGGDAYHTFFKDENVYHPVFCQEVVSDPSHLGLDNIMGGDGLNRVSPSLPPEPDFASLWHGLPEETPASSAIYRFETKSTTNSPRRVPGADASLLHLAVAGGNIETVRLILKQSPSMMQIQDKQGYTPIQLAAVSGQTEILALLLQPESSSL
ncbi:hypothetical protein JX265_010843 [Neoarthrinium moseri]|uniref:BZIP domain-containing protein n=1 Tax=Neoarthrinium moseri TaxID=1658444 RepID=A0A9P9WDP4_9PEZI|nr:hypothetical protein JX266_011925 [Neoarthrinium moseri]KAI1858175.1 hypothetical protein JX265_010843 [Neoarthrinium moseri]